MFHHFHDDASHKPGQGSINKEDFYKLIKFIGPSNILDAQVFFQRFKENKLKETDLCLSFDDGLRCQFDLALPVLEDLGIKAFFFIYTSIFEKDPDLLEIYRYFRINYFSSLDEFYKLFYEFIEKDLELFFQENHENIKNRKEKFPFYSEADIKFRLVRDKLLKADEYRQIMFKTFDAKSFDYKTCFELLFLNKEQLIQLDRLGHTIGLHSHSHPTFLENLSYEEQKMEYQKNRKILAKILSKNEKDIKTMSHPCGNYNQNTLAVLHELGIELGFKQNMSIEAERGMDKINNSPLELAREDHANLMRMMQEVKK